MFLECVLAFRRRRLTCTAVDVECRQRHEIVVYELLKLFALWRLSKFSRRRMPIKTHQGGLYDEFYARENKIVNSSSVEMNANIGNVCRRRCRNHGRNSHIDAHILVAAAQPRVLELKPQFAQRLERYFLPASGEKATQIVLPIIADYLMHRVLNEAIGEMLLARALVNKLEIFVVRNVKKRLRVFGEGCSWLKRQICFSDFL